MQAILQFTEYKIIILGSDNDLRWLYYSCVTDESTDIQRD